jgi:hypothetical protein
MFAADGGERQPTPSARTTGPAGVMRARIRRGTRPIPATGATVRPEHRPAGHTARPAHRGGQSQLRGPVYPHGRHAHHHDGRQRSRLQRLDIQEHQLRQQGDSTRRKVTGAGAHRWAMSRCATPAERSSEATHGASIADRSACGPMPPCSLSSSSCSRRSGLACQCQWSGRGVAPGESQHLDEARSRPRKGDRPRRTAEPLPLPNSTITALIRRPLYWTGRYQVTDHTGVIREAQVGRS